MSTTTLTVHSRPIRQTELRALRQFHATVLGVSVLVIVLSASLQTLNTRQVALPFLEAYPLPELCQSKALLGIDCPGCGLTRSFIHFFHGRPDASFAMHRFGWLLATLILLQIPYRLAALMTPSGRPLGTAFPTALGYGLLILLAGNWILKLSGI